MKILHVTPTYLPATRYGGPIYSVHGLCKALATRGHEVDVATTNVDGSSISNVPIGTVVNLDKVKVRYYQSPFMRRLYWSPGMKSALAQSVTGYDIVHLHSVFLWPTTFAASLCRVQGIPYVISPRGMLVQSLIEKKSMLIKKIWIQMFEKRNLENAAAVHFTSAIESAEFDQLKIKARDRFVIPNGIETDFCEPVPDVSKEFDLIYIGRINWKKGLDKAIRLLTFLKQARFMIAGYDDENYSAELKKLAHILNVSDRVIFRGPVGEEKKFLMAKAKLFVLMSQSENFANNVLEAMAIGCPPVISSQVGLADAVAKHNAGLVLPDNEAEAAAQVSDLLASRERIAVMSANAKSLVLSQFLWSRIAELMELSYLSLIRQRGKNES